MGYLDSTGLAYFWQKIKTILYSASNPPPYPVTSVNNRTGAVTVAELPAVTASDNGKVIRVVDGAWAAVQLPSASGVSF